MGNLLTPEALKTNDQRWRNQTSLSVRPKGRPTQGVSPIPAKKGKEKEKKKKQKTTKKVKFPFIRERSEPVNYPRSPNGRTLSVPAFPCSIMGQVQKYFRKSTQRPGLGPTVEKQEKEKEKKTFSRPQHLPPSLSCHEVFFFFLGGFLGFSFPSLCLGQKQKERKKKKIYQKNSFFLLRCEKKKK